MGNLAGPFVINGSTFNMSVVNYTVPLDNIEIWSLTNQTPIAHPFHIHDVQFFILDINGNPPPAELQGLNDVVLVPAGMGNVRFIAQFSDFANNSVPYMYHCHMLTHEDGGMMGQFLVVDESNALNEINSNFFELYPNPTNDRLFVKSKTSEIEAIEICDVHGRSIVKIESHSENVEMDVSNLNSGVYIIRTRISGNNSTQRFVKN